MIARAGHIPSVREIEQAVRVAFLERPDRVRPFNVHNPDEISAAKEHLESLRAFIAATEGERGVNQFTAPQDVLWQAEAICEDEGWPMDNRSPHWHRTLLKSGHISGEHVTGYSTWAGQATLFGYREWGPITLVATLGHGRLKADERLLLFAQTRSDQTYRASLGATFRNFRIGSFAPFLRATFERNRSTTEIYDFGKVRTEMGVTRAF